MARLAPNMSMYIIQLNGHTEDGHFGGGAEVMTSGSVVEVNQPFGSMVMWIGKSRKLVAMPPQTARRRSEFRDQSSLEIAKGEPEENDRLAVSRSQSEEVEMPNEITSPSRRTFRLAPSRSCACGSRDGTASRTHRRTREPDASWDHTRNSYRESGLRLIRESVRKARPKREVLGPP